MAKAPAKRSPLLIWAVMLVLVVAVGNLVLSQMQQRNQAKAVERSQQEAMAERLANYAQFAAPQTNVILGDSLVAYVQWNDVYPDHDIAARGFPGATSGDLLEQLELVTRLSPQRVFLQVGTNDFLFGEGGEPLKRNIDALERQLEERGIEVVRLSIPHCDCPKSSDIRAFNSANPADLDLAGALDKLDDAYRDDGFHLSSESYAAWKTLMEPALVKSDPPG